MPSTLLAQNAQSILNQALTSPHGILIRIHCAGDVIQPAKYGRQILYHFKGQSPDYETLIIHVMDDRELWIIK